VGGPSRAIRWSLLRRLATANGVAAFLVAVYIGMIGDRRVGETETSTVIAHPGSSDDVEGLLLLAATFVVLVGLGWYYAATRLERDWRFLEEARPATADERAAVARQPFRIAILTLVCWIVGFVNTTIVNWGDRERLLIGFVVVIVGAITASVLGYLLAEQRLRPVLAVALSGAAPPGDAPSIGVGGRLTLAWALGSAIPLLAMMATPFVRDDHSAPLEATLLFLAVVGLVSGLALTRSATRSITAPLRTLRAGLLHVQGGELDTGVSVDDAGDIGEFQAGFNDMVDGLRARRRLEDLFGRHVGEDVARRAMEQGVALGGERRTVTVFFVDLMGSTALARQQSPEDVVETLNRFFAAVVGAVAAEGGWVNKFEGDGAMCVFGAPADQGDHARRALRAAIALHRQLERLGLDAGIGVSTGEVVAGNVGTESRHEYTVVGQPVNEAARLTEAAKRHPGRVLTSVAAHDGWITAGTVDLRGIGEVAVAAPAASA
jgi:adenylate cyclase